jgi:hypothetical protein
MTQDAWDDPARRSRDASTEHPDFNHVPITLQARPPTHAFLVRIATTDQSGLGKILAWPPTYAFYAHRLHLALRRLIDRAERLGARLPGYPEAMGERALWLEVYDVEVMQTIRFHIPDDTPCFPCLYEAERWLGNIISGLPAFDRMNPPPTATGHAHRLASPDHLRALRSILAMIPNPFDGPRGNVLALFEWSRYHLGTEPAEWDFDATIPADFWGRWADAEFRRRWSGADRDAGNQGLEDCRRLLTESGLLRVGPTRIPSGGEQAPEAPSPGPPVILGKPGEKPKIRGKEVPSLTVARYNVVMTLLKVWPNGLSKDELPDKSGHPDAVNVIKEVRKLSPEWESVILLPGRTQRGLGYRIARS